MEDIFKSSSTCLIVPERKKRVRERGVKIEETITAAVKEKVPVLQCTGLLCGSVWADCAVITNHTQISMTENHHGVFFGSSYLSIGYRVHHTSLCWLQSLEGSG